MISNINVRIDKDLKDQVNAIFDSMGLNMSVAVTAFLKRVVADGQIPFSLRVNDSPLTQKNPEILEQQITEIKTGHTGEHSLLENEENANAKVLDKL